MLSLSMTLFDCSGNQQSLRTVSRDAEDYISLVPAKVTVTNRSIYSSSSSNSGIYYRDVDLTTVPCGEKRPPAFDGVNIMAQTDDDESGVKNGNAYAFKRLSTTNKHDEFYVKDVQCAVKWEWFIKPQESPRSSQPGSQSTVSPARE